MELTILSTTCLLESDNDSKEDDCGSQWNLDVTVAYTMEESGGEEESETLGNQGSCSPLTVFRELHFWYIDPDGRKVLNKDQAAVTINGKNSTFVLFLNS